jgi:KipI family sensor histidine kinase inhibitor
MGDTALLCEVDDLDAVHRLLAAIITAAYDGVVDVVPGWRTVLVTTDGLDRLDELARRLRALPLPPVDDVAGGEHVIAVAYDGPDLNAVAALTNLAVDEVVRRHTASAYTVAFLGFQPGFPYLAGLDHALAVPRKETPRTHIPAGSVGLAGDVTGIYPRSSPGGWQLIGHTDVSLFDVARDPPALLAPGDTVRFEVRG